MDISVLDPLSLLLPGWAIRAPLLRALRLERFAGSNLYTEASFKTVILNTTPISSGLVKRAMGRIPPRRLDDAETVASTSTGSARRTRLVDSAKLPVPELRSTVIGSAAWPLMAWVFSFGR